MPFSTGSYIGAMRPFSDARAFDVVRYDTCRLNSTGSVTLDSRHTYAVGPNHAKEDVIVARRAFSIEFLSREGSSIRTFERQYGQEKTETYDMEALLRGLYFKPNSWMNSPVREEMEDGGFKKLLDSAQGNERRRLLYMFGNGAAEYGFPVASLALNSLCIDGHVPSAEDMSAYCRRLLSFPAGMSENVTDVNLSVYDKLLAGAREGA